MTLQKQLIVHYETFALLYASYLLSFFFKHVNSSGKSIKPLTYKTKNKSLYQHCDENEMGRHTCHIIWGSQPVPQVSQFGGSVDQVLRRYVSVIMSSLTWPMSGITLKFGLWRTAFWTVRLTNTGYVFRTRAWMILF